MESSSIFKPYQHYDCWRGDRQIILRTSIGRQLPFIVNFKNNLCQIFDVKWEKVTHSYLFPDGCNLIDADYFPTKERHLGILVAVQDVNQALDVGNYVVALCADPEGPTMKVTHSMEIPVKITTVKTLFSSFDMVEGLRQKSLGLFHRLLEWDHVVAVGCKETRCYLTHLTPVETSSDLVIHRFSRKNATNLLDAFTSNGAFQYSQDDGCYRDYPASAVYVSALALMPRSRTLLVGLSMGGILSAALNPSNQMVFLELRHERLIREIAPLEPEDDPDKFEYFIAAVDRSSKHPIMIQLWRGSFKSAEEVDNSEKYDRPVFGVCLEHKIPFGERWLTLNPIVMERGLEGGVARRREDSTMESMLNVSQAFGSALDRSHVFLAYERKKLSVEADEETFVVEAAIFDIDAWYYKRTPGRVSSDGTTLRQCAFMSCIKSDIPTDNVGDVGILTLCPTDVSRFSSLVSDADQLFYPSGLSYDRVIVAEKKQIKWMKIQNLQETILDKCASKLPMVIRSSESMASDIIAAGLVRKNILSGSPNSSAAEFNESELSAYQKVILSAMVYYGKAEELCGLATRNDLSDRIKAEIAEWAMHEAVDFKRIISDRTVSLFQGNATSLSPLAEDTIIQGVKLFWVVSEYLRTCAKSTKDCARFSRLAHSVMCMRNHTKLVGRFIISHIVPVDHRVQHSMREMHEKRKNVALKLKTALPIQVITRTMHRLAPDSQFWNDMPHDEWYPPTPLDLLESILNVNISERVKRELVVQYIVDWLRANPYILQKEETKLYEIDPDRSLTDADRDKILALETIKVMTNLILDVDLEKIYFLLDQEKIALTKKTTVGTDEEGKVRKIFLSDGDGLSYEKLWNGKTPMAMTIGSRDMERFEQRMKMQTDGGEKKKMPLLDPETEMLYQVFLFEKQKFSLMSEEAIESNELLSGFKPGTVRGTAKNSRSKTAKELEIEQSVKTMIERNQKNNEEDVPEVFAAIGDRHGKKRKSELGDGHNTSPVHFVPPTAKRIQPWKKPTTENPVNPVDLTSSSISSPQERDRDAEINMMIATPARYYKRPVTAMSVNPDMVSPVHNQKLPPVPAQNSILKTAKAVQSPSRGRIRFHESVRRGANESSDSADEGMAEPVDDVPKPRGLNFAILEDVEEDEAAVSRHSIVSKRPANDHEIVEDECIEMEKSFENQEEFEVLEDVPEPPPAEPIEEDTFEIRTDDIIPGTDETFDLTEREELPETNQETKDHSLVDAVENFENATEEKTQEIAEDEEEEKKKVEEEKEASEPWDGIHRSFEIQKDEDCEPVASVINEKDQNELLVGELDEEDNFEEAHEELAEDILLNRTFEVQDEDPQPRADVPDAARKEENFEKTTPAVEKKQNNTVLESIEPDEDRPPSANTRFAAARRAVDSRSTTPVEAEQPAKPSRKSRAASATPANDLQDNNEDRPVSRRTRKASESKERMTAPTEPEETVKTPRKSRATSVKKDPTVLVEEEMGGDVDTTVMRKTRASSVKRTAEPSTSIIPRARTVSRTRAEVSPQEPITSSSRSARSTSRSVTPSRIAEQANKPKKSPARGKKTVEEERPETPTEEFTLPDTSNSGLFKLLKSKKSSAVRASSVLVESAAPSSSKRSSRTLTSAPSTPRRGRSKSEAEGASTVDIAAPSSSKKRHSSESDDGQKEEPPKKARGRPRNTPLKVIPETTEEVAASVSKTTQTPKRAGSRSRNNSTSSVGAAQTTPKRGRKPILDEVAEETEEAEPATPLRRSARRLQNP